MARGRSWKTVRRVLVRYGISVDKNLSDQDIMQRMDEAILAGDLDAFERLAVYISMNLEERIESLSLDNQYQRRLDGWASVLRKVALKLFLAWNICFKNQVEHDRLGDLLLGIMPLVQKALSFSHVTCGVTCVSAKDWWLMPEKSQHHRDCLAKTASILMKATSIEGGLQKGVKEKLIAAIQQDFDIFSCSLLSLPPQDIIGDPILIRALRLQEEDLGGVLQGMKVCVAESPEYFSVQSAHAENILAKWYLAREVLADFGNLKHVS